MHLRTEANAGWHALAIGEARLPVSSAILARVQLSGSIPGLRARHRLRLSLIEPAKEGDSARELRANEDRLFDVTDLGIV